MRAFILQTTEHADDDVPWCGDGDVFRSLDACRDAISKLQRIPCDNSISLAITDISSGDVVERKVFDRKLF